MIEQDNRNEGFLKKLKNKIFGTTIFKKSLTTYEITETELKKEPVNKKLVIYLIGLSILMVITALITYLLIR